MYNSILNNTRKRIYEFNSLEIHNDEVIYIVRKMEMISKLAKCARMYIEMSRSYKK